MKDALQKRLAVMEQESPSPSLQLPEYQTRSLKERLYFGARALLGSLMTRKQKDSPRAVQEAARAQEHQEHETYAGKRQNILYETPLNSSQNSQLFGWQLRQDRRREENARADAEIIRLKSGRYLDTSGKMVHQPLGSLSGQFQEMRKRFDSLDSAPQRAYFSNLFEKLTALYESRGMEFPQQLCESFLEKKGMAGAERALKELEGYVTSNNVAVSFNWIQHYINRAASWLGLCNKGLRDSNQLMKEMKEKYAREARTVAVSEASQKYAITIVHGIPYYKNPQGRYPQFANNWHWVRQEESRNENPHALELEDFVENLFTHRPDMSASAIRKDSAPTEFFSPYGIIIREGKIYDADISDLTTIGETEPHLVRMSMNWDGRGDIVDRVREVATTRPNTHNEVVLGDQHEIGGLYFTEDHHGWGILSGQLEGHPRYQTRENPTYEPAIVARIAKEALQRNVPLYRFRQGEGFAEVNPAEYLATPAVKPAKKARARKTSVTS